MYQAVDSLPCLYLGEELNPFLEKEVENPSAYHLVQEILPGRNQILYSYLPDGHLSSIELKNPSQTKIYSFIHFTYEEEGRDIRIQALASDQKSVDYLLSPTILSNGMAVYSLVEVTGSHTKPVRFGYQTQKNISRLVEKNVHDLTILIDYTPSGKVKALAEKNKPPAVRQAAQALRDQPDRLEQPARLALADLQDRVVWEFNQMPLFTIPRLKSSSRKRNDGVSK
jgi:hypothetical protein